MSPGLTSRDGGVGEGEEGEAVQTARTFVGDCCCEIEMRKYRVTIKRISFL